MCIAFSGINGIQTNPVFQILCDDRSTFLVFLENQACFSLIYLCLGVSCSNVSPNLEATEASSSINHYLTATRARIFFKLKWIFLDRYYFKIILMEGFPLPIFSVAHSLGTIGDESFALVDLLGYRKNKVMNCSLFRGK